MSEAEPQFFYFDLGNVLVRFDHQWACRNLDRLTGCGEPAARAALFDSGLELRYERGDVSTASLCTELRERLSCESSDEQLGWAVNNIFELNVRMTPLVSRLASSGRRLGILSNTCEGHWEHCIGRFRLLSRCFEVFALSYQLRALKPEPLIYHRAAELVAIPGDRLFFVDDRPENVAAAVAAGWDAILFESPRQVADELGRRGVDFNY